ncbi:MAG: hypothetical protein A2675_03470 [Candidatus Yonathbacteria bacterium RIFCSPHIGHO2_01_FULL_51_10]|uniref:Uncharacterized protein n=1 Tax=Candidatus Yonathbacteria bacterium RIFCSPHIGHO2_01_FULL_51_10 TaxID=1802723 RepID=A0A1G2SA14_9BACT|nr:MAG: hypothetical protein A2675_03470 [Candidatus Yonathbacteria bacterium RIFCSPHIGHO2_01_FULL_51_10]
MQGFLSAYDETKESAVANPQLNAENPSLRSFEMVSLLLVEEEGKLLIRIVSVDGETGHRVYEQVPIRLNSKENP